MTIQERINQISNTLTALQSGWPHLLIEIDERIQALTTQLVSTDNEQTRGRIKALCDIKELPETLKQERDGISAALSEQDAAN